MAMADCPRGAKIDFFGNNWRRESCLKTRLSRIRRRRVARELFGKTGDPREMIEMRRCVKDGIAIGEAKR